MEKETQNIIIEIRAGAGGDEASLFAEELFKMYAKYAEKLGFKVELMSAVRGPEGGYKEVILRIAGADVENVFKYESGVHRVQRVPATEARGRVHTSTVTVAVLAENVHQEVEINPRDLRIDVFRASGHGGQSVNTTDSAVRITHLPSGIVVSNQDEKSQHKNRDKAMRTLKIRLQNMATNTQRAELSAARRGQIGTGDRSEKIRTYNFPQDRITDHRLGKSWAQIDKILEGHMDKMVRHLQEAEKKDKQ